MFAQRFQVGLFAREGLAYERRAFMLGGNLRCKTFFFSSFGQDILTEIIWCIRKYHIKEPSEYTT